MKNISSLPVPDKSKEPAILITRQTGGLGDLLMITPTIRAIKLQNPDLPLFVSLTDKSSLGSSLSDILKNNPYVDKVVSVNDLINCSFSKVYNLGTGKEIRLETDPNYHINNRIDIFSKLAGVTLSDKKPIYIVSKAEKKWVKNWIEKHIDPKRRRLVGLQYSTSTFRRNWPIEKQKLLGFQLINTYNDISVLVFSDKRIHDHIYPNFHYIEGMPIRHVAALINECELMVLPDSGLLHLAGALDRNIIALFGPTPPNTRICYYENAVGVWLNYPCGKENCWYSRCLAGDTKIPLLSGKTFEIKDLVDKAPFEVYACTEDGAIVPGKVDKVWKTGVEQVIKITLDNGEFFKCTTDHKLMLRDGTYLEANKCLGKSVMPYYIRLSKGVKETKKRRYLNHKIVSIEFSGTEDVYDMSVNKFHNFAIGSGIFVHNCFNNFQCMKDITVDMVMKRADRFLESSFEVGKRRKDICVIRMGGIGDLVMLSSALKSYSVQHPDTNITLATMSQHFPIFKNSKFLDGVIDISDVYKLKFDKVIDLRWRVESPEVGGSLDTNLYKSVNRIDMFERLLDLEPSVEKFPEIIVDEARVGEVKKLIKYSKKKKWLAIQATCTSNTRTIPPEFIPDIVEKFSKVKNLYLIIFGKTEYWGGRKPVLDLKTLEGPNMVNLIDKLDLPDMVALCSIADYIIAPDSSAIHIAGALGKRCIALFGNIDPYVRIFYYPTVKAIYPKNELDCIPCWDFVNPCSKTKEIGGACMRLLTPDRISEGAKDWFSL